MPVYKQLFQLHIQPMVLIAENNGEVSVLDANEAFLRLTGYDKTVLLAKDGPHVAFRYPAGLSKRIVKSEMTMIAQTGRELHIRYEQVPLPSNEPLGFSRAFAIFEDLTAYNWIDKQLENGNVLLSGIVDEHMHIRFLRDNLATLMFEPDRALEDESLLSFVEDADHELIRTILEGASGNTNEQSIKLHTSKLSGLELELEITYMPIMDGFGKLKEFAFVIWDLRPSYDTADASVKLKIWMAKRDMSAGQLSAATGISLQTISKLRNGKIQKPQRLTAELIAAELRVDVNEIWTMIRR
ncbi:helix-turn-helix transcriptional regulator [Paenibacillus sp. LHD-117]|uniref:helix-turn-helix transcriptional regulator n=1 Tax=Paenibacillus sp. LHD-117 TaxID=3071412 RepID=UPI0027E11A34|nr:helix-turn-helix transcriptional regulator [Paenibacillus sp. LHD-117]MDQ6421092.1 helix-turn-helix transcriptional regulator [Paenibacillus sp. LHD-117]